MIRCKPGISTLSKHLHTHPCKLQKIYFILKIISIKFKSFQDKTSSQVLVFLRLWAVMCPHKRKEWFWGIKTSSVKGWMVQVEGGAWGVALKEPGPSNTLSLQLSSPEEKESLTWSSCGFCSAGKAPLTLVVSTRISAPSAPLGLCCGFPSASLILCKPLTHPELLLAQLLPHLTKIREILLLLS